MPLEWPSGRPRSKRRSRAAFGEHSISAAVAAIQREITRLRARNLRIDHNLALRLDGLPYSNQKQPEDPGVAVYFTLGGMKRVLCCDKWDRVEHNLWAIAKTIDAKRGVERWGAADVESEYAGYAQLPAGTSGPVARRLPHEVLGVAPDAPVEVVRAAWRALIIKAHPDNGGEPERFREIQEAYEAMTEESLVAPRGDS